jgi:DNA-binding transcriptional regulator YiaG
MRRKIFSHEFLEWRVSLGMTRQQAANALGMPVRTVQGWELGRQPQHPSLVRLAMAYLGLTANRLAHRKEPPPPRLGAWGAE